MEIIECLMFVSEKKESWSVDTDRESDAHGSLGGFPSDDGHR